MRYKLSLRLLDHSYLDTVNNAVYFLVASVSPSRLLASTKTTVTASLYCGVDLALSSTLVHPEQTPQGPGPPTLEQTGRNTIRVNRG